MFLESVRKNARDCFEKKDFAGNHHFQGTANFEYLEAIKYHFDARNGKFGQILRRIQSYFIFCPLHLAVKGPCRKSSLSRNSKFRVLRVYSSASRNSIPSRNFQLGVEISTQNFSSQKTGWKFQLVFWSWNSESKISAWKRSWNSELKFWAEILSWNFRVEILSRNL